ncbi:MAG: dihydroorotate dehydrogenase [Patescibacteria group bacterium]|nr:dihydroorotate dehydrogenase [Patescibacteria group bacterium]
MVKCRNGLIRFAYKGILKPLFFRRDPEDVHDAMTRVGVMLGAHAFTRTITRWKFGYSDSSLQQRIWGITFPNPIGLAAGFDKDAELTSIIPSVGFGFEEIGSVTGLPCAGNPKPRLWRLPKSQGLVVWYGLKNKGSKYISEKLRGKKFQFPIGTSVAMTNCSANLDITTAISDYHMAFEAFTTIGDYYTVNISCPNVTGGQPFVEPEKLDLLLTDLDTIVTAKPICIKLSPDISLDELDQILVVAEKHRVHGIICGNLTKNKDNKRIIDSNLSEHGGISGKPTEELSNALISHIYKSKKDKFVIIGCGGVFSAEDAYKKIKSGASLIQLITGMIFEGPQVVSEINCGLTDLLRRDGFSSISEAVGVDSR